MLTWKQIIFISIIYIYEEAFGIACIFIATLRLYRLVFMHVYLIHKYDILFWTTPLVEIQPRTSSFSSRFF